MDEKKVPQQSRGSTRLAKIIEENEKRREKRRFIEELSRRINIAREGRVCFEKNDLPGAMRNYRQFLALTAKSCNVETHELHPKLFGDRERISESLLISAIALDLAKILDQLSTDSARKERGMCFHIYIVFTVGMPFQGFVAEGLRKYITNSKVLKNRSEFQATYNTVKIRNICFIATAAFADRDAKEVQELRLFRDRHLSTSAGGRALIKLYYAISPAIAKLIERSELAQKFWRAIIRSILKILPNDGSKPL